jgi:type IV pilus assembly protein PilM
VRAHAKKHKRNILLSLFPPPKFLAMPAVGVDISDCSIKAVELAERHTGQALKRFSNYKLDGGIVTGGQIKDEVRLGEILMKLQKDYGATFVRAALPEQQAYVFETQVAAASDEEQIAQQLEFKLEENVPLSPREVIIGYDILETHKRKDAEEMTLTVTAYPRAEAERYIAAFETAGLTPLSLEIESQAIARAVVPEDDAASYLVVDFGETRTGLMIVTKGLLALTSTLEVPGHKLTDAIKAHGASGEEVVRVKNEEGIRSSSNTELRSALVTVVSDLTVGIVRHFNYWNSRMEEEQTHEKIKKVILCGGNANLAGLPEYVAAELQVLVERANVWTNTFSFEETIPDMPAAEALSYATAIGLALRKS